MRAIATRDGLYDVPDGSYVSSAVATRGMGGGGASGITITGPVYIMAADANVHDAINGQMLDQSSGR